MIREEPENLSLFDKANAAAKAAMQSVVDIARHTKTPVIVFRNGRIERLLPDAMADQRIGEESPSKSDPGKS